MLNHLEELYPIVDDFCKEYEKKNQNNVLDSKTKKKRKRKTRISLSEIISLLILYQSSNIKNFKAFYRFIEKELSKAYPNLCSYNRFIELAPRAIKALMMLLNSLYASCNGVSYVDSTSLKVCHIKREKRHKLFKDIASKSKSTMGWFYGFKLHIMTNTKGELLNAYFSHANVDDRLGLLAMCKKIFGNLIGDRGYLGTQLKQTLHNQGINLITRGRKNMKNHTLNLAELAMLNSRNLIETVIGKLKLQFNLEHTRHRSISGFIINILACLIAYCFSSNKPKSNIILSKILTSS
jgi:hypothetical protein